MKRPDMEPQNVCFSIIKKCLAAPWERLLGTVVWLWKGKSGCNTCAYPSAACCPKVVSDYNDIAALWLPSAAWPKSTFIKQSSRTKERDLNSRQNNSSFILWPLAFLCCDSKLSFRQLLHYASVYLRHHSCLLFPILTLPSQLGGLFFSLAADCVAVHCPPVSAVGRCMSFNWDKNKGLSSIAPVLESSPGIR